jgi:AcrR family transcriptional regulator
LDPAARREQILEHAAILFGQKGYHSTSISDIIQSAGIARGTFYLYFKNKRSIFNEILDLLVIRIQKRIKRVDPSLGSESIRIQILKNITGVVELLTDNRALLSILLEGAVGLDKGFADKLNDFYRQVTQTIELSLRLGQEMALVRSCNTKVAALAGVGALKEVLHDLLRNGSDALEIGELSAQLLDIFIQGVIIPGESYQS